MNPLWWAQIRAVVRLELRKTFFARRGLWIYLLALAPVALFLAHTLVQLHFQSVRRDLARQSSRPLTERDLAAVQPGMTRDELVKALGPPPVSDRFTYDNVKEIPGKPPLVESVEAERAHYSNGKRELIVTLERGAVVSTGSSRRASIGQDTYIFAGVFQFFFIRLAIFFGCLGIFINLFRGEMLDKSLHFYLLAPVRREVLLVGKYVAGLLAATVIFSASAVLQQVAMLWEFDADTLSQYLYHDHGIFQIASYLAVTVLACIGYGSIFVAAGLLFRNPIFPAAFVLIWEAASPLLPSLLQKFTVIHYLKALCPVAIPVDPGMPALFALLVSNAEPTSGYLAVLGLLALSVAILAASMSRVRHLQINYATD